MCARRRFPFLSFKSRSTQKSRVSSLRARRFDKFNNMSFDLWFEFRVGIESRSATSHNPCNLYEIEERRRRRRRMAVAGAHDGIVRRVFYLSLSTRALNFSSLFASFSACFSLVRCASCCSLRIWAWALLKQRIFLHGEDAARILRAANQRSHANGATFRSWMRHYAAHQVQAFINTVMV